MFGLIRHVPSPEGELDITKEPRQKTEADFSDLAISVMQSDGNIFSGDFVLDSFNKASRDVDNILDQIYRSKCVRIINIKI